MAPAGGVLSDDQQAGHECDQHDRDVDQEHRSQPEEFKQDAAKDGTEGCPTGCHGSPDTDGKVALSLILERMADDGQRRGHHHGRANGERDAACDQHLRRRGKGRQQRCHAKDQKTAKKHHPWTEPVAERTRGGKQTRNRQRIGVDDPELLGRRGAQFGGQPRQGGIKHRHVNDDQQQCA